MLYYKVIKDLPRKESKPSVNKINDIVFQKI